MTLQDRHSIARWLPAGTPSSRRGAAAVFSIFFYLVISILLIRTGSVLHIWQDQHPAGRGELLVIFSLVFILYAAGVFAPLLNSSASGVPFARFSRRFQSNRPAVVGLLLLLAALCAAALAPLITSYDPAAQPAPAQERYMPPSSSHPMGTDKFGRDIFSRVLYGARVSLSIGILSMILAGLLGTLIGAVSGYFGGWTDSVTMRVVDGLLAFPRLLLVLTLVALFSNSYHLLVLMIAGTAWMGIARLVRSQVLTLKSKEFIEAARASGSGRVRIICRHLIPNSLGPVLVAATLKIGGVILLESSLSFLGLGVEPPTPSWGGMVFEGREVLLSAWWVAAFPALTIVVTVISCNLLGDGLRDAMDVRTPV